MMTLNFPNTPLGFDALRKSLPSDTIENLIKPKGLAVIVKAKHQCMTWRGVKDNETEMVTSVMRGIFRETAEARSELMDIFKGQGYK